MAEILVIDDSVVIRNALRAELIRAGHVVHEAVDGVEGIRQAQNLKPDLIILDVVMPAMDGMKVHAQLRRSSQTLPIVFLSAMASQTYKNPEFCPSPDVFLPKPPDMDRLLKVITLLLKQYPQPKR
ncbi:MAG: response regulator [Elusimicrobiota bacterium]|jgi:DNA-binding response OmpR family regulator